MKLWYVSYPQIIAFSIAVGLFSARYLADLPSWVAVAFGMGAFFVFNGLAAALELLFRTPVEVEEEDA